MTPCIHCGTTFSPATPEEKFCCRGCECVHELIHAEGLTRFYDLKTNLTLTPARGRPFESPDLAWLERAVAEAENRSPTGHATLDCSLEGLSCVACVWLVERLFEQRPGAIRAISNPARASLHLEWQTGACDIPDFARELARFGYTATPAGQLRENKDTSGLAARTGLCGAFALNAMGFTLPTYLGMPESFEFAGLFRLITFLSATLAMLVGASWFIIRAWRALRLHTIHIDLPIALGLIAAYLGSTFGWIAGRENLLYFDFVCTFVFLMLGGRWLQTVAVERNRRRLNRRSVVTESVQREGKEHPVESLASGDRFELPPGRALPVAATLGSATAEFSLEWIRGESDPVETTTGSVVPAGAILLSREPATLTAREPWADSLMSRLTAEADSEKNNPALQRLLRAYLIVVLIIGIAGFIARTWFGDLALGLETMIAIFVVSCPCALGVAIPLADERATKLAARAGVFVRRASLWSRLARVRSVVFDKTGTLTLERPVLDDPTAIAALPDEAATTLAQLTSGSAHPVARTLLEALGGRGQRLLAHALPGEITDHPGQGVTIDQNGTTWSLGKSGWLAPGTPGSTILARGSEPLAAFRFTDRPRPGAAAIIRWLGRRRLPVHILSGDHPEKVAAMAAALGIPASHAHGSLSPDEKAARIGGFDHPLYLGDGANDSLAFDQAHLTGTPVADRSLLERKCDFYTLGNGLTWLPELFAIAGARTTGVRRAFTFAVLYNSGAITLCLAGLMNPLLAAILMPLSSIISIALVTSVKLAKAAPNPHDPDAHPQNPWPSPSNLANASTSGC